MKCQNLLCVKSILTIVLAIGFTVLCFIYPEEYTDTMKTLVTSVVTFYFSHQIGKYQNKEVVTNESKL